MNERRKSDNPVVPAKSPNKGDTATATSPAEGMEGSGLAKGNSAKQTRTRAQTGRTCNMRWTGYEE